MGKRLVNRIPFRMAMALCIVLFLLFGVILSAILIHALDRLWESMDTGKQMIRDETFGGLTIIYQYSPWVSTMNAIEGIVVPFFFCSIGALTGAAVFYRWKMKKPLTQLFEGVKKVQNKELDFTIAYDAPDELGALCTSFETMRSELDASFKALWRTEEDRKRLNAAFAHDLRTPLTVIKGQADMLQRNMETGKLDRQKAEAALSFIQQSIARCERYIGEMTSVQKLEEITPEKKPVMLQEYVQKIDTGFSTLVKEERSIAIRAEPSDALLHIDESIVTQVLENLVSNALRYAKQSVALYFKVDGEMLMVRVTDDGCGFSAEALQRGLEPFYRGDPQKKEGHLGLGLNICKILTQKHGGSIVIANSYGGGAQVTATFSMKR